ncbi:MAG TPA: hypothetical protein VFS21_35160 [Roseiflexaceae bacterium]|nr:hypothetical protein [Roseiflexaceae bacterium]
MNNQPQTTAPEPSPIRKPALALVDPALLEALCALQEDGPHHTTLQSSPLALLAEWLNGLTGDGLVLWRQGSKWLWCWQGTDLVAEMDRLGLGDAVADALAARYASGTARAPSVT